jgi:hypothetical protein
MGCHVSRGCDPHRHGARRVASTPALVSVVAWCGSTFFTVLFRTWRLLFTSPSALSLVIYRVHYLCRFPPGKLLLRCSAMSPSPSAFTCNPLHAYYTSPPIIPCILYLMPWSIAFWMAGCNCMLEINLALPTTCTRNEALPIRILWLLEMKVCQPKHSSCLHVR